jgi:hypothetical protein
MDVDGKITHYFLSKKREGGGTFSNFAVFMGLIRHEWKDMHNYAGVRLLYSLSCTCSFTGCISGTSGNALPRKKKQHMTYQPLILSFVGLSYPKRALFFMHD